MTDMPDYDITYSIRQAHEDGGYVEIGFGASGHWPSIDAALYAVQSDIQNKQWETEPGMPDPGDDEEDDR